MGLANLRNLSVSWNKTALDKLVVPDEKGQNLIFKGWGDKETYGKIFDENFQVAARERRNLPNLSEAALHERLLELSAEHLIDCDMPNPTHPLRCDI